MRIDHEGGFRIVIDVVPDGFEGDPIEGGPEGYTALASLNDLPDPDARGFDHDQTLAFAASPVSGEAGSAVAAVVLCLAFRGGSPDGEVVAAIWRRGSTGLTGLTPSALAELTGSTCLVLQPAPIRNREPVVSAISRGSRRRRRSGVGRRLRGRS